MTNGRTRTHGTAGRSSSGRTAEPPLQENLLRCFLLSSGYVVGIMSFSASVGSAPSGGGGRPAQQQQQQPAPPSVGANPAAAAAAAAAGAAHPPAIAAIGGIKAAASAATPQTIVVGNMKLSPPTAGGGGAVGASVASSSSSTASSATGPPASPQPKAGTKRSITNLPPLDRSGRNLSEKKIRRLEKNRLSARECRRKKKEAAQNLEREINLLEAENLRLRLQLQVGEEAEASSWQEQHKLAEGLDSLLKSGASDSEIFASIEEFKEKHADYGRDRRSAMEFHLRNVERLLMPTTTTSVAMRALQGGDDSSTPNSPSRPSGSSAKEQAPKQVAVSSSAVAVETSEDLKMPAIESAAPSAVVEGTKVIKDEADALVEVPSTAETDLSSTASSIEDSPKAVPQDPPSLAPKSMFHYLVKYLDVTPEQAVALKDSRFIARELDSALTESLSVLEELRMRLAQVGEDLEAEMDSVRAILTPTQAAKFLVWISNNGACMHMLNELWNKSLTDPQGVKDELSAEDK